MLDKSGSPGARVRCLPRGAPACLALLLLLGAPAAAHAQSPPPDQTWLTLHTEHFRVTFPEGLQEVAEKAAERAERAYEGFREGHLPEPAVPIELLLTDHVDLANGFAAAAPYNRIVVWLSPPLDGLGLSHFDDWLELVITHELAHVFHLDYVGTPGRIARAVFGRAPRTWPFVMGHTLPVLAIEGFATHQESALTEGGRLHGSFQEAAVRAHALDRGVESVDRGIGASPLWPGGNRPYVYGSLFFLYLEERFGDEAVADFLKAAAGQWIPYRLDAAARRAFGESFSDLWDQGQVGAAREVEELEARLGGSGSLTPPEELTRGARTAFHAAPHPSGDGRVAYFRADGRTDTRLVVLDPDGRERSLTRWNAATRPSWTPEGDLVATQIEFVDRWRLRSDLFRVSMDGDVTRLTRGLRVAFADVSPRDGRIVAVLEDRGRNRLVLLGPEGSQLRVLREAEAGTLWSHPRWSPDGSRIAVARWRAGGWTGIRILDLQGEAVADLGEDRSLNTAPSWSPEGRHVVWSSDRTGVMNVYARELEEVGEDEPRLIPGPLRQATNLLSAGHFPAVSPDGRWLYLSLLRGDGWELARVPFEPTGWADPLPADPRYQAGGHVMAERHQVRLQGTVTPYSAWRTVRPRYWLPLHESPMNVAGVEVLPRAFGFETSATDLVERHRLAFQATFPLGSLSDRLEAAGRYTWSGLGNPALFVEGAQVHRSPFLIRARTEAGAPLDSLVHRARERFVGVGAEFTHQQMRRVVRLTASGRYISVKRSLLEMDLAATDRYRLPHPTPTLVEGRATLAFGTARSFPFSVSTQEGISASISYRERRDVAVPDTLRGDPGVDGGLRDVVGVVSGFRGIGGPGFAPHVLAVRGAWGTSRGPGAGNNHFVVGGGGGGGTGPLGFTYDADRSVFPVRGFPVGTVRGETAWGASVEWRFPLAMIHRGFGAWPLHLDRLSGGIFVEGAGARSFDDGGGTFWVSRAATGAELVLSRSFLFESPGRIRGGVALPLQGPADPSVYLGFGWGF